MGTKAQTDRMIEALLKYRKERKVEEKDRDILDDLHRAAIITYDLKGGALYAKPSPMSRKLLVWLSPRIRIRLWLKEHRHRRSSFEIVFSAFAVLT